MGKLNDAAQGIHDFFENYDFLDSGEGSSEPSKEVFNTDDELMTELSFSALLHEDEATNNHLVAFIKKHELQARIDENNRWRTILVPSYDYNTADMEDFNDRVVELKQELEKL